MARKTTKKSKSAKKKNEIVVSLDKENIWKITTALLAILLVILVAKNFTGKEPAVTTTTVPSVSDYGTVKLDFYVMSQCPYGTQVEDAIAPVLKKLGNSVDFSLNFIASDLGNGQFQSLHGQKEVDGDIVQLCAAKYNPGEYMDMILCMNENAAGIPGNWESCAQENGLAVDKIKGCYEGDEGKQLLSGSIKETNKVGATGSPTIYLNDERYSGSRDSTAFTRALCNKLSGHPECSDIPEPKKVSAIVLNDKRCAECDVSGIITSLKSIFPGLETVELDYSSEQGRKLYEETGITNLPAMLFDDSVTEGEGYSNVRSYLLAAGDYLSLRIGASFDPHKEICTNGIDDTGNGKVDCDDEDCKESIECRAEKKNNVQVFIMSDCPYGRMAIEALKAVVDNFGTALEYEVHYIASENADGTFSSLHGQYEVDEDIIQLCVKENSPKQWLDYLYCRSTKGVKGIDWKQCATETGVATAKVESCFTGTKGKALLSEDIKIANSLSIGASPTWLANNRYVFSGIDAETVKTNVCRYNQDLSGCENVLSTDTGGLPAGGGC